MRRLWFLMVLAMGLVGCTTMSGTESRVAAVGAGHGGGIALMRNGEYMTIDDAGNVTGRCLLCDALDGDGSACADKAGSLGIEVCPAPPPPADVPRATMVCSAYGPAGPLPPVPFGTAGYACYMTSPYSCLCLKQ